jgi:hypothetical protein
LQQLAFPQAPSPFDLEGVGHAEGSSVAAQRLRAPMGGELLEALVIKAGELGWCRHGSHVQEERSPAKGRGLLQTGVDNGAPPACRVNALFFSNAV